MKVKDLLKFDLEMDLFVGDTSSDYVVRVSEVGEKTISDVEPSGVAELIGMGGQKVLVITNDW